MFSSRTAACLFFLLALGTAACNRGPARPFETVAILPFEDLSPSGNALLGRAASRFAASLTEGDRTSRVTFEPSLRDAQLHRATRTISGWLETANGQTKLHGTVRDETTGKTVHPFEFTITPPTDISRLADAIASQTGAPVRKLAAPKAEAAIAYERSLSATSVADAVAAADQALSLDPKFGAAAVRRVALAQQTGDATALAAAIATARAARLTDADRARLDLTIAPDAAARVAALSRLAAIESSSPATLDALLNAQIQAQDFKSATETANRLLELTPNDEDVLNRRGYAYTFAGDLPGARRAFEDYRKRRPESANAIDSMGEALFYFRRYDEAAGLFLEAHRRNPALLAGAEPFRAALSYALAGNLKEADAQIGAWFKTRTNDPVLPLRQAIWARMTGRQAALPQSAAGVATDALYALRDGDRTRAAQLASDARKLVHSAPEATLAVTAALLAQPSASTEVWKSRIAAVTANPQAAQIRTELTGWALLLDRHYSDAADMWRPVFNTSSVLSANDSRMLLFWALAEAGAKDEAHKVMPEGWLPPASLEPGLGILFYPKIPELRAKV